jgi:hypothetical protein
VAEGDKGALWAFSYKGTVPFIRFPSSLPDHLSKTHIQIPPHLGLNFNIPILRGYKPSVYSRWEVIIIFLK